MDEPTKPDYKELPLVETPTVSHDWPGHLAAAELNVIAMPEIQSGTTLPDDTTTNAE